MVQIILANMVNELMTSVPGPAHVSSLNSVSPRKLWLANHGDILILPRGIPAEFSDYVSSKIDISLDDVHVIVPAGAPEELLPKRIMREPGLSELLAAMGSDDIKLVPFAQDRPALGVAEALGIPIAEYGAPPDALTQELIYRLNTKSGLRSYVEDLGFKTVPGRRCVGRTALVNAVKELLPITGKVICKYDRSSNGYGSFELDSLDEVTAALDSAIDRASEQPAIFLVESYFPFTSVPSVELLVTDDGAYVTYICEQRSIGNAWRGMVTPAESLSPGLRENLRIIGQVFGQAVHRAGYRGYCDVDCGITADESIHISESNFRRTGGTYLDSLIRRLCGPDYLGQWSWTADVRLLGHPTNFKDAAARTKGAGLDFDPKTMVGILLTCDTFELDGKLRYLSIARTTAEAKKMEDQLLSAFDL